MQKQIIGHRGAPKEARENTLEAFKKALEMGVDVVEMDVRKTKDGKLVAFHNETLAGRRIGKLNFTELNQIAAKENYTVPTFEEVLKLAYRKSQVEIEIKALGYEVDVVEAAMRILGPEGFSIISFNFSSINRVKSKNPKIRTGLVLGFKGKQLFQTLNFLTRQKSLKNKIDFIVIHKILWQAGMTKLLPKYLPIIVWPADKPKFINKLLKNPRIYGLTSNRPDIALKLRKEMNEQK
jgi:glycerophosphoryl diester phosphodiesterase